MMEPWRVSRGLRDQKVQAWARHVFTNGDVVGLVGLPDNVASEDETYVLISRSIDGETKQYLERFRRNTFMDSYLSGALTDARTVYGLQHLEGEIVEILGDNAVYRVKTVEDGRVTIDDDEPDLSDVQIGLSALAEAEMVEPEFGNERTGITFGKKKRWVRASIRTVDTISLSINEVIQPERSTEDNMDEAVPTPDLFDFTILSLEYENQARLRFSQTVPRPATVIGAYGIVEVGDQ